MTKRREPDSEAGERHELKQRELKERVLHTRVPEMLADELKRLAESMRVPVSNVVRTFLEDAVDAMSAMSHKAEGELLGLADRLRDPGERKATQAAPPVPESAPEPSAPLAGVIGFQPLVLAQDTECSLSGRPLRAGEQAYLGIRRGEGPLVIVAPECVPGAFASAPRE